MRLGRTARGEQHRVELHAEVASSEARLGPSIAQAELDARLADGRLSAVELAHARDGESGPGFGAGEPRVESSAGELGVRVCAEGGRPAPAEPRFVSDASGGIYVVFAPAEPSATPPPGDDGPMFTVSCGRHYYTLPAGASYLGELDLE